MNDAILIHDLELRAMVGVPEVERAEPQRLTATLRIEPKSNFSRLDDRIENAVDYAKVCDAVKQLVAARPRRLIETLAEEIATDLLARFPIACVSIELRKFILPDTRGVAVIIERRAGR
ncbi:MAG: 7,8-dihydroneopterin aldolase/epimerase/oxygenase [Chthoniobacter sp.]|jgi:FolB domain-containing protein|nr:7,8-dihydroneopterin aldolase/epimerase/oxygenase [Chthoniobacter sp.]